ncbi:uncharacterized protein LOC107039265 [Diachasma alloeum]|uniref:uncharacterized protein LOC107039265 n=1 Tax=Diachasma alloeum TaxID=454923 RepID=UPI0007385106|nr:uncharacterized protein LOC107039265 [Diachasma alloeum]
MTVMLLQRFAAPHAKKILTNSCEYEVGNCQQLSNQLTLVIDNNTSEHIIKESVDTIIDKCYCNNNNKTNNSSYTDKEKIINATNTSKNEQFRSGGGCCHNQGLSNINNNNSEATESDELLGRNRNPGRQETITSRTTTVTTGTTCTQLTSASQSRYCSQGVVMRYYRLWIYACNIVLLGSALGFAAVVSRTLLFSGDPRRYLVPGVPRAWDPTALYAYLALATQLGLVQLLGCIAARRLSAKLLNAYWVLLLALLFGDAIIGVAWVFRFERMRAELRPVLRLKLQLDYGREGRFSDNWDRLQRDFSCCGVTGPSDFDSRFIPESCCGPAVLGSASVGGVNANNDTVGCHQPFNNGCEEFLMQWLRKTADLLFVLGFCVIAFAKLCFLGILRYEIREMIQKIRLLREPPPMASAAFIQSFCQPAAMPTAVTTTTASGSSCTATATLAGSDGTGKGVMNYVGPRRTTLPIVVSSSTITNNPSSFGNNVPLLPQQLDQDYGVKHPLLFTSNLQQDTGADSDTNSHCALILEETTPTSTAHRNCNAAKEKSNGNNNYEMREFNRRYLMSNGGSPPTGITIVGQNRKT